MTAAAPAGPAGASGGPSAGRSPAVSGPVDPDPAVLAAITAAVDQLWTGRTVVIADEEPTGSRTVWRFSGRWWAKPTVARRERPWSA